MHWVLLFIAGLFEVGFAFCLGKAKMETGLSQWLWFFLFFVCLSISMYLLYKSIQVIPIGTAYAIWTGIGATGTVIVGLIFFKEPVSLWRMVFLFTLIASIVGLKIVSK